MKLPPFEYSRPATIDEAVALLVKHDGNARPLSGGQSLMPMLAFRLAAPDMLVDLGGIAGLDAITIDDTGVHLGARVRWRDIEDDSRLAQALPILAEAVGHIAHYQIRNRGTVGGSLANADPASELPAIAVACDATLDIAGKDGRRELPAADLFLGPLTTSLEADEIIIGVRFAPWASARRWAFEEFATHRGAFALAGVALWYETTASGAATNVHIGVLGAASTPRRLAKAEAAVEGNVLDEATIAAAAVAASAEVDPSEDIHAGIAYRRALVGTLLTRAFAAAEARGRSA